MNPRWRRLVVAGGLVLSVALVAGCHPSTSASHQSDAAVFDQATLTNDNGDGYAFTSGNGAITVNAPTTNRGLDTRVLFWPAEGSATADSDSCAEWTSDAEVTQQGAAVRIALLQNRGLRAILVTKNIWLNGAFNFNVHVVDTTHVPVLKRVGYVSLRGELFDHQVLQPLPWFMCARASGRQVQILVWHDGEPMPRWGDRSHGGSVTLPAGWIYPGKAGWYIGHLPSGGSAGFTNLYTSTVLGTATHTDAWTNRNMVIRPMPITRVATNLADVTTHAAQR